MDDHTTQPSSPQRGGHEFTSTDDKALAPPPKLDHDKYAPYVADLDLTDDQKREMLQALWDMMVMFADLEFGMEATQLACGQIAESQDSGAIPGDNQVE